jgi:hypothetical protein
MPLARVRTSLSSIPEELKEQLQFAQPAREGANLPGGICLPCALCRTSDLQRCHEGPTWTGATYSIAVLNCNEIGAPRAPLLFSTTHHLPLFMHCQIPLNTGLNRVLPQPPIGLSKFLGTHGRGQRLKSDCCLLISSALRSL